MAMKYSINGLNGVGQGGVSIMCLQRARKWCYNRSTTHIKRDTASLSFSTHHAEAGGGGEPLDGGRLVDLGHVVVLLLAHLCLRL